MYVAIKHLHIACATINAVLFVLRGVWVLTDSSMLRRRWVKVIPHVNDTVLLAAAVALTMIIGQYPVANTWLTAKVTALVLYIGLGFVALREGRSRRLRLGCWLAALVVLAYIVSVAVTKNPLGPLVLLGGDSISR